MTDDTFVLLGSIKLLNKHLWGNEEEITMLDTFDTPRSEDTGILQDKLWGMNPPKV
ncbi:MAG: hypothetical protein U7126_29925 [Microcoleus sp.]